MDSLHVCGTVPCRAVPCSQMCSTPSTSLPPCAPACLMGTPRPPCWCMWAAWVLRRTQRRSRIYCSRWGWGCYCSVLSLSRKFSLHQSHMVCSGTAAGVGASLEFCETGGDWVNLVAVKPSAVQPTLHVDGAGITACAGHPVRTQRYSITCSTEAAAMHTGGSTITASSHVVVVAGLLCVCEDWGAHACLILVMCLMVVQLPECVPCMCCRCLVPGWRWWVMVHSGKSWSRCSAACL